MVRQNNFHSCLFHGDRPGQLTQNPKRPLHLWLWGGPVDHAMRLWGWLLEGATFAILAMNLLVPLIKRLTKPQKLQNIA